MADKWERPTEVRDFLLAFPFRVVGTHLPERDEIPIDFFRESNVPHQFAQHAISSGLPLESRAIIKNGIDSRKAIRHIFACLLSSQPEKDHKLAGVAFLVEKWFVEILTPSRNYVFSFDRMNTHSTRIPEL